MRPYKNRKQGRVLVYLVLMAGLVVALVFGGALYYGSKTIFDLLTENKQLKAALTNLTQEDQIGYAKVLSQTTRDGQVYTKLKFVETARDNKLEKVLETDYEVQGDVIYFDALIVKFDTRMVMDGKERALYLWRRVYGEKQPPESGYPIETAGQEPQRYAEIMKKLSLRDREMFWSAVWDLSNEPERLRDYGLQAIFGNVVYTKLRPGLIYIFKIDATGQVSPEVVPDM